MRLPLFSALSLVLCFSSTLATVSTRASEQQAVSCSNAGAPFSIAGNDLVLQIEANSPTNPSSYPTKGAIVVHYKKDGTFSSQNFGSGEIKSRTGTYKYQRTGFNTSIEKDMTAGSNSPTITKYTFNSETSGKWVQEMGDGQVILSGSFSLVSSNVPSSDQLAPASNTGLNIALLINDGVSSILPPNVYPKKGISIQTYAADGTMTVKSFGPSTLDSHGTYTYTKIASNAAVEEVIQTTDIFTLPYTMVYIFETPTSGKWFQNLGDGLIKFTGTFNSFPN